MRSWYRVHELHTAHFITATTVAWLPIFTKAARCDIVVEALLQFCRAHMDLKIHAWVIFDNHLHAILSAPDLSRVMADFKRHTAGRLIEHLQTENCDWLLNQLQYFRAAHKVESEHQLWREGSHPQAMLSDEYVSEARLFAQQSSQTRAGRVA